MKHILFLIILSVVGLSAHAQTEPRLVLPIGHTGAINSAVFSPDGKLVLTASEDKTARIYDVATGKELRVLAGHLGAILAAKFSPDCTYALTGSEDGTARIWDVASGTLLQSFEGDLGPVNFADYCRDGNKVLTLSQYDGVARSWNAESEEAIWRHIPAPFTFPSGQKEAYVYFAEYSPDGKVAALLSTYWNDSTNWELNRLEILDSETGVVHFTLGDSLNDFVRFADFSADGKLLLTVHNDRIVRARNVGTGGLLIEIEKYASNIISAVFDPEGKKIVTTSEDQIIRVWDLNSGKLVHSFDADFEDDELLPCAEASFVVIDVTKDENVIILDCDKASIWNLKSGQRLFLLNGNSNNFSSTNFSPDGRKVVRALDDGTVHIWDVSSRRLLHSMKGANLNISSALFTPEATAVVNSSIDGNTRIWETNSGRIVSTLIGQRVDDADQIGPIESKIVSKCESGNSGIYNLYTGKLLHKLPHDLSRNLDSVLAFIGYNGNEVVSANFSVDGSLVITRTVDNIAGIWNANSGRLIHLLEGPVTDFHQRNWLGLPNAHAEFSPNGKLALTTHSFHGVYIWDVSTGRLVHSLKSNNDIIISAHFCSNGRTVVTLSEDASDGEVGYSICGWDLETETLLYKIITGSSSIFEFSANNERFIDSILGTIRVWDVSSGRLLKELEADAGNLIAASFSPNGQMLVTVSDDNALAIWDLESGRVMLNLEGHAGLISSATFSMDGTKVLGASFDGRSILWNAITGNILFTHLQLIDNDWLVYDEHYRFDGTPGAIEKLYFVCGLEPIDLAQMKDSLWVPGLAEKIINKQDILINDKPAPKLSELNICELTPVIEPIEQEDKRMLKYRITPRNGGLGNTEVYINGNLTFSIKPEQLVKGMEDKKEVYYLTLNTDTLQEYLMGEKRNVNPILVKCKVKGTGIYGRGVVLEVEKTTDEEEPHFYGVFIGVDEYGNPQKSASDTRYRNLDFAAKDAQDLSVAVEQTARNLFKDNCHIYRLTGIGNEAPTKENLQRVLADVGSHAKASDVLYIFFAGHGDIRKGENDDGQPQDQIRFMLMNADKINPMTTSFGVDDLTKWCSPRNIKAQKRVFVFDACHSGKIIDQTMAFNGRGDDEGARIRQLDKLKDKNGMMILAAAADDESAYEDETLNQGVLTYHLLQVMKEEANDTSLVVRDWFDETIDLVKEYSRLNGNKQEPSSFGDGRFEIGNVRDNVRDSIKITCPKTRVGACEFVSYGQAMQQFPNIKQRVNEYFASKGRGDKLIYSKNSDKAYKTVGLYIPIKDETQVTYDLYRGEELVKPGIELPLHKYNNEDELVQAIVTSIAQEIEALSKKDERCKLMNK